MAQANSLYLLTPEEERSIRAEDKCKHRNIPAATVTDVQLGSRSGPLFCGATRSSQSETVDLKSLTNSGQFLEVKHERIFYRRG